MEKQDTRVELTEERVREIAKEVAEELLKEESVRRAKLFARLRVEKARKRLGLV